MIKSSVKPRVRGLGKAAIIILPQLNVGEREKLIAKMLEKFQSVICDTEAKTQFFFCSDILRKGKWITGGILIVGLNPIQGINTLAEFFAEFAEKNNLLDALSQINVILEGQIQFITLRKE